MENATPTASYVSTLEQRPAALTAERDSFRSMAGHLSSERDTLQGVVEKMRDELRRRKTPVSGAMVSLRVAERLPALRP